MFLYSSFANVADTLDCKLFVSVYIAILWGVLNMGFIDEGYMGCGISFCMYDVECTLYICCLNWMMDKAFRQMA